MNHQSPAFQLPKREGLESLIYHILGFSYRKDLTPREQRLIGEIKDRVNQIRKG